MSALRTHVGVQSLLHILFLTLGIEFGALRLADRHSAAELHPGAGRCEGSYWMVAHGFLSYYNLCFQFDACCCGTMAVSLDLFLTYYLIAMEVLDFNSSAARSKSPHSYICNLSVKHRTGLGDATSDWSIWRADRKGTVLHVKGMGGDRKKTPRGGKMAPEVLVVPTCAPP